MGLLRQDILERLYKRYYHWRHGDPARRWSELKGACRGRCGFVIGNGPSLKFDDLTRIQDEVSIASNKIYLAYPHTPWRPTYYSVIDEMVWAKTKHELHEHFKEVIVPRTLDLRGCRAQMLTYRYAGVVREYCDSKQEPLFSENMASGVFGGHTVTFDNLQLAVHLGLDPIYIIGCDHYYAGESDTQEKVPVAASEVSNHFIPNYRQPGELVNPAPIEEMNRAYQHAAKYAWRSRVRIYNATRGGHLEAFPRADLDQVLDELGHPHVD